MNSNAPSENMKQMYSNKRKSTLSKIQYAINDIKEDNRIVTKKELIETTGISSGTFSQDYVKELLKENKVCQFRETISINSSNKKKKVQENTMLALKKENQSLISKMQDFEIALELKDNNYKKMNIKYKELDIEYKLLKGKYQQLLEYLDALGVNLDSLPLI